MTCNQRSCSPDSSTPRRRRSAFTLVELLVVIGIIALLISILLPSLNKARRQAKIIKCAANLRSLMQAVNVYAAENRGSLPGSAWTTSRFLFNNGNPNSGISTTKWTDQNVPNVLQVNDWMGPISKYLRLSFDDSGTLAARKARYVTFTQQPAFLCSENTELNVHHFGGPDWGDQSMPSYCAAIGFLVQSGPLATVGTTLLQYDTTFFRVPSAYNVTIAKVGSPAKKIFLADAGKYAKSDKGSDTYPDYNAAWNGTVGGMFADVGPYSAFSSGWNRDAATGNLTSTVMDPRVLAYRHGVLKPRGKTDDFRGNFAFFDGHVELMGDLQSADPNYWLPKGSTIIKIATELQPDVYKKYYGTTPPVDATIN